MARLPHSPGVEALKRLEPKTLPLAAGTRLARVYYTASQYPAAWNLSRRIGAFNAGLDQDLANEGVAPAEQQCDLYYAAADATTCLAEFFQATRCIDRAFQAPWLVIFDTAAPLRVFDLSSDFVARMGASLAIHSGAGARAGEWARDLYEAYPDIQAIRYASSMNAGAPALAINVRASPANIFPAHPAFHRGLGDDLMLDPLKNAARALGYALR
jgi:hypothetical protein